MEMVLNMHIHKPGHSGVMTRGGQMQSSAPLLKHCRAERACWPTERWLQPRCPVRNQNALKAQFSVLLSVCIGLVKASLHSDRSGVLRSSVRVCQTETCVCMHNAHSCHLGISRGLGAEYKSSNRTATPKWTTRLYTSEAKCTAVGRESIGLSKQQTRKWMLMISCAVGKPLEEIYIKTSLQAFKTPRGQQHSKDRIDVRGRTDTHEGHGTLASSIKTRRSSANTS